jgi:hypothetical protein
MNRYDRDLSMAPTRPHRPDRGFLRGLILGLLLAGAVLVVGCGGGESTSPDSSVQQQLQQARRQGAAAAHRQERIAELRRRVSHLERKSRSAGTTASSEAAPSPAAGGQAPVGASTAVRTFHAPSGNVSCAILPEGALCSVSSAGETFIFKNGEAAAIESGTLLAPNAGEPAPYGSTISAGRISCTVPLSDEPRGVVCFDSSTGHGFEASRVASRQHTY